MPVLLTLLLALNWGCGDSEPTDLMAQAGAGQGADAQLADAAGAGAGTAGAAGDAATDLGPPEAKSGSFGWKPRKDDKGCPGAALCPCDANEECLSGFCLENPGGKKKCASTCIDLCPEGYECVTAGNHQGKKKVCRPADPTPDCEASDEICDGKDNDCDGLIDDDCTMPTCPLQVGFDSDPAGDVILAGTPIATQYAPWLLDVSAANKNPNHPDLAITFDSDKPTGGDNDLATPDQHNLLIIAENEVDNDGDGLIDVPDDEAAGGELTFKFKKSVHVYSLRLVDIEEQGGTISVTFKGGVVEVFPIPALTNGSIQDWTFNKGGVTGLTVKLAGSGAVDALSFCPDAECVPGQEICDGQDNDCDDQVDEADGGDLCSDGDVCNGIETCGAGSCNSGEALDCDDDNPCTADLCDAKTGCKHIDDDGKPCDDGDPCTDGDHCKKGKCGCGPTMDCDDGNPCTSDTCKGGKCKHKTVAMGTPCDDNDACTSGDTCQKKGCVGSSVDCDDGKICTIDSCHAGLGCTHKPNHGASCDDGNACTSGDTCMGASCDSGAAINCTDGNPCTDDSCDLSDGCQNTPAPGGCSDGNACTQGESCQGGKCVGGQGGACDDGNPCTDDACDTGKGCMHKANGLDCDDGDLCTQGDACKAGICTAGGKVDCDDGNPCTGDYCAKAAGCVHLPIGGSCDDGNVCTVGDACKAGVCTSGGDACGCQSDLDCAGQNDDNLCNGTLKCDKSSFPYQCKVDASTVVSCSDAGDSACLKNTCDPASGSCSPVAEADGTPCDADGSNCTKGDACKAGDCAAGAVANCDDDNPCTIDGCDPAKGCAHKADDGAKCDDGDACNGADLCTGGDCKPASGGCACPLSKGYWKNHASAWPVNSLTIGGETWTKSALISGLLGKSSAKDATFALGAQLTASKLNVAAGAAAGELAAVIAAADAFLKSHPIGCNPKGAARTKALALKDKLDKWNNSGKGGDCPCTGGGPLDCDDGNPCTTDGCDAAKGCTHQDIDGGACDDGDACTSDESCVAGVCMAAGAPACDDGNPCTTDTCLPDKGCCHHPDDKASCSDGDPCTTDDACKKGNCAGAGSLDCNDGNPCTTDACTAKLGCTHTADDAASCDDGNACTTADGCEAGACVGGPAPGCEDGNPCTADACDPAKGCVHSNGGGGCDDGDACTGPDQCVDGNCTGGSPVDCNDGDPCTSDTCDPK